MECFVALGGTMTERPPTNDDVQSILKLYELRREQKLRLAREWYQTRFFPQSFDEIKAVVSPQNPDNAYFRMVTSYWDMAASFVNHGAVHEGMFLESAGEMFVVWVKVETFVQRIREELQMPRLLVNVEKLVGRAPGGAERMKAIRARLAAQAPR
jgi:hypothetical protein